VGKSRVHRDLHGPPGSRIAREHNAYASAVVLQLPAYVCTQIARTSADHRDSECDEGFDNLIAMAAHEKAHELVGARTRPLREPCKVTPSAARLPATPHAVPLYGDQGLVIYKKQIPPDLREQMDRWVSRLTLALGA
jgi:hypothetical protein